MGGRTVLLQTTLDDVTGEVLGFTQARVLQAGASDAVAIPCIGKKGRSAHILQITCNEKNAEKIAKIVMLHTGTLGIKQIECKRHFEAEKKVEKNKVGARIKRGEYEGKTIKKKMEYEDAAKLAIRDKVSIEKLLRNIKV